MRSTEHDQASSREAEAGPGKAPEPEPPVPAQLAGSPMPVPPRPGHDDSSTEPSQAGGAGDGAPVSASRTGISNAVTAHGAGTSNGVTAHGAGTSNGSASNGTGGRVAMASRPALHLAPAPAGPESSMLLAVLDAVDVGVVIRDAAGVTLARNTRARLLFDGPHGRPGPDLRVSTATVPPGGGSPELVVDTWLDDGTEHARELAPVANEHRFQVTMEHSPVGFALLEPDGTVIEANRALARMLGLPAAQLPGRSLCEHAHPDDPSADADLLGSVQDGRRESYTLERRYLRPDGQTVWARTTITAVRAGDGAILHLVAQLQDVSEIRLVEEALQHQALHDPLTGLPNRTLGLDRIQQALDRTDRTRRRVAVLCCELDRFKVVNESIGPAVGDAVLVEVARRLQRVLRNTDTAARIGGDEFAVVCEDVQDEREAVLVADRILAAIREPIAAGGRSMVQTLSIGIAVSSARTADAVSLLRDASTALHRAKDSGRGGSWDVVDDELRRRAVDRLDIEHALRVALQQGELRLYFQPIVDLASGRAVGQEALVRWQHPTRGLLAPARFLPVAEETGLIEDLGRWVLLEAARTAVSQPGSGYVAVNVSASQVMRAGLLADVEAVLEQTSLPAGRLVVELTESVMLGAAQAGRKELHRLDDLGVRLVVDDFGTGFSALSYLRDLPVSGIKVDRSFTAGLGEDAQCDRIVEALTGLAHGLGVDLVAEGVETERQRNLLTRIGCVHAQGYLFGRPAPTSGRPSSTSA